MQKMKNQFEFLRATRRNYLRILEGLSLEQVNKIPEGFKNNIIWNAGHAVVTQQLLQYKLSGTEPLLPEATLDAYRKGSAPKPFVEEEEVAMIKEWLKSTPDQLEKDYNDKKFGAYKTYTTSYGVELNSIEDAINFNTIHEGLHLGTVMALRKKV